MVEHQHDGVDANKLNAKYAIQGAPQSSLTTKVSTAFSTGGGATLSTSDSTILDNMRTRINELETKLTNLGLIS